jgi:hypothetical protein
MMPIFTFSPRPFVAHTAGAPTHGTLSTLSGVCRSHARHRAKRGHVFGADVHAKAVRAHALRRQDFGADALERGTEPRLLGRNALRLGALRGRGGISATRFETLCVQFGHCGLGQTHEHLHATVDAAELRAVILQRKRGVDGAPDLVRALRDQRHRDDRCRQQHRRGLRSRRTSELSHWMIPRVVEVVAWRAVTRRNPMPC